MNKLSLQEAEEWMSFYYQHPQPDLTPLVIDAWSKEGILRQETAIEPIVFFLSFIFRANPDKIVEWTSHSIDTLPLGEKEVIIGALWLSNTNAAQDYLTHLYKISEPGVKEIIKDIKNNSQPVIEQEPIDNPRVIDNLWAAFMATGEEKYVIRIVSVLRDCKNKEDDYQNLMRNAALWSLKSNAKLHDKVKLICKHQLTEESAAVASILQEIINEEN